MAEGRSDYPGYYPGSPIYRQPRPFKGSKAPMEFKPGMADEFFESLSDVAGYPGKFPAWMWKQEVNNIKSSFMMHNARDFGTQISQEAYQAFGQEELEELPGAQGASIDYNPLNWISDPKKQVRTHLERHWKSIVDHQDFKQVMQREIWSKATTVDKNSPYYIDDNNYNDVRTELPRFMSTSASAVSRNASFKDFNMSVLNGLQRELTSKDRTGSRKYDRFAADDQKIIDKFSAQVAVANSMSGMSRSVDNMKESFSEEFFSTKKGKNDDQISSNIENLRRSLKDAEDAIALAEKHGVADYQVKAYKNYVSGIKDKVDGTYVRNAAVGRWELKSGVEKTLHKDLKLESDRLFRKTIDGGIGGAYIRRITNQQIRDQRSDLNSVLRSKDGSGYITSDTSRNLNVITGTATRTFEWRATWDLIEDIEKGKLPTQFIYNRLILPRIERYTPSYHLKKWFFKSSVDADGNARFRNPIVNFFEGAKKQHTFKVNISGVGSMFVDGGGHFNMSPALLSNMLKGSKSGGISPDIVKLLNNDIGALAAFGIKGPDAGQLRKTRAWLLKHGKAMGLELDATGKFIKDSVKNQKKLTDLFSEVKRRKLDPTEFDPKISKTSRHGRYAQALSKFQASVLGKVYRYTFRTWDVMAEKLIDWGGRALEKIFGAATGGVGAAVAWAARIVLVYAVKKVVKKVSDIYEAIKKQDIRFFENAIQEVYNAIATTVAVIGVFFAMLALPVALVIQVIIGSFSSPDTSKIGGSYIDENVVDLPPTSFYADPTCGGTCEEPSTCLDKGYSQYICLTIHDKPGGGQPQL